MMRLSAAAAGIVLIAGCACHDSAGTDPASTTSSTCGAVPAFTTGDECLEATCCDEAATLAAECVKGHPFTPHPVACSTVPTPGADTDYRECVRSVTRCTWADGTVYAVLCCEEPQP